MTLSQARGVSEGLRVHRASPHSDVSLSYYNISSSHQLQSLTAGSGGRAGARGAFKEL